MRLYRLFHALSHLIEDGIDIDLLTRTIDGAVCINTRLLDEIVTIIITIMVILIQRRTVLVFIRIGKNLPPPTGITCLEEILALIVSHHVKLIEGGISDVFLDVQTGSGNGLTGPGTHHHIPDTLWARLVFGHGIDIRHEIQTADNLCLGTRL